MPDMLQILHGDRNVFLPHSAAGLFPTDKASIMHMYSRSAMDLTVWKSAFGPSLALHHDHAINSNMDAGERWRATALRLRTVPPCSESCVVPAGYLKLHASDSPLPSRPPHFPPNPQESPKSIILLEFWSVFPVSQKPNVKASHCGIPGVGKKLSKVLFLFGLAPLERSLVELKCLLAAVSAGQGFPAGSCTVGGGPDFRTPGGLGQAHKPPIVPLLSFF